MLTFGKTSVFAINFKKIYKNFHWPLFVWKKYSGGLSEIFKHYNFLCHQYLKKRILKPNFPQNMTIEQLRIRSNIEHLDRSKPKHIIRIKVCCSSLSLIKNKRCNWILGLKITVHDPFKFD
jgi:hypothetical protein